MIHWMKAREAPESDDGTTTSVIVARRSNSGEWYVFGAFYLNNMPLVDDDDQLEESTGFCTLELDSGGDEVFVPIDIEYWAMMPDPPTPW